MTREQAMQAVKKAVYNATGLFETLDKEGRLKAPGRQVREELSEHVAEFVAENWVSFDEKPNVVELGEDNGDDDLDPLLSSAIAADEKKLAEGAAGEGDNTDGGS